MGTKRRIQKTTGYPTTDGGSFTTYKEAIVHQTDLDIVESCKGDDVGISADNLKKYLSENVEVVQDYIKHHVAAAPAVPAEKPAKPAKGKDKDKE